MKYSQTPQHSEALSNSEFHGLKDKAYIIDVRTNVEVKVLPTIPQSINIYVTDLLNDPNHFLKHPDQLIITYCNAGNRSGYAAQELRDKGFKNAYFLRDGVYGYNRWLQKHHKHNE